MAAVTSTNLLHEFIARAAKQIAREQSPEMNLDKTNHLKIRNVAESTVKELAQTLEKVKKVESGHRIDLDLTQQQREVLKAALEMVSGNTIFDRADGQQTVTFKKDKIDMFGTYTLEGRLESNNIFVSIVTQMACIVLESLAIVLRSIGIKLQQVDNTTVKLAIGNASSAVTSSSLLKEDIGHIITDQDNISAMGKDIFRLVINMFIHNRPSLWDIVKCFFVHLDGGPQSITQSDWFVIVAKISAFLALLDATDGTAKFARLVMELGDYKYFLRKLADLKKLTDLKKTDGSKE